MPSPRKASPAAHAEAGPMPLFPARQRHGVLGGVGTPKARHFRPICFIKGASDVGHDAPATAP